MTFKFLNPSRIDMSRTQLSRHHMTLERLITVTVICTIQQVCFDHHLLRARVKLPGPFSVSCFQKKRAMGCVLSFWGRPVGINEPALLVMSIKLYQMFRRALPAESESNIRWQQNRCKCFHFCICHFPTPSISQVHHISNADKAVEAKMRRSGLILPTLTAHQSTFGSKSRDRLDTVKWYVVPICPTSPACCSPSFSQPHSKAMASYQIITPLALFAWRTGSKSPKYTSIFLQLPVCHTETSPFLGL